MITELLIITGIILIVYIFYKYITQNYDFFKKRGIAHLEPKFFFGNTFKFFMSGYSIPEFVTMLYERFPNEKIFGIFDFSTPICVIRDPDVLKKLTVTDFDHFEDHRIFADFEQKDNLFSSSLFLLTGQKWRDMRSTLSPAFTGSKMRQMFELVSECADDMVHYFVDRAKQDTQSRYDVKDIFSKYTSDVIATCAFGVKVNSFVDEDNEFYRMGQRFLSFTDLKSMIKFLGFRTLPRVMEYLDIEFIDKDVATFFRSTFINNMDYREKNNIHRPDLINILMQVRNGNNPQFDKEINDGNDGYATVEESNVGRAVVKRHWTENEIISQCFFFFLAAFETTSTILTFIAYELAVNPGIQDRLYAEVRDVHLDGKRVTYDVLQKMKYLDQIVSEGLRKWPPNGLIDRVCVKDYEFVDGDKRRFIIPKKTILWFPTYAFHHDANYFPDPEIFDPERFNDENRKNIIPGSYIPFGSGPRSCIGSRFALMGLKAIIYHIVLNFILEPNENTPIPMRYKKSPVGMSPEKTVSLDFKPRH